MDIDSSTPSVDIPPSSSASTSSAPAYRAASPPPQPPAPAPATRPRHRHRPRRPPASRPPLLATLSSEPLAGTAAAAAASHRRRPRHPPPDPPASIHRFVLDREIGVYRPIRKPSHMHARPSSSNSSPSSSSTALSPSASASASISTSTSAPPSPSPSPKPSTSATSIFTPTPTAIPSSVHPIVSARLLRSVEAAAVARLDAGRYVTLNAPAANVRSTISIAFSHDGSLFASTHGDHSVKVFEYPSGKQVALLTGHPRTPWTVRFHPSNRNILASGCLGSDCRVWDVPSAKCIRKHTFRNSISCVSFNPTGDVLAVTSGRQLLLWRFWDDRRDGADDWADRPVDDNDNEAWRPVGILDGVNPFHMVDFHPSGTMLMTGEKNKLPPPSAAPSTSNSNHNQAVAADNGTGTNNLNETNGNNSNSTTTNTSNSSNNAIDEQFTLRLVVHRFDRRLLRRYPGPLLVIPRVVAYNDAGIHFSPCGTLLAACVPAASGAPRQFRIAVLSLRGRVGAVVHEAPLDRGHVTALTNLKFSASGAHLLAGFSFRPSNPVLAGLQRARTARKRAVRVVDIYKLESGVRALRRVKSLTADFNASAQADNTTVQQQNSGAQLGVVEDEINVAVFGGGGGVADGVVYGTQKGRIRMFQMRTGRCDDEDGEDEVVVEENEGEGEGQGGVDTDEEDAEGDDEFADMTMDVVNDVVTGSGLSDEGVRRRYGEVQGALPRRLDEGRTALRRQHDGTDALQRRRRGWDEIEEDEEDEGSEPDGRFAATSRFNSL